MRIRALIFGVCFITAAACNKSDAGTGKLVEIYKFKITRSSGPCKIDSSRAELAETPLISNSAIRSYNKNNSEFLISNEAGEKIKKLMDNEPLAVTVDKELIYYFVNKPSYSSSICNAHISMEHFALNKIRMYIMSSNPATPIPDQRNDSRLINALRAQGKLN